MKKETAIAIAAHPDDIEFMMAGTLVHLRNAGFAIHYFNVATGSCGSRTTGATATRLIRRREAMAAARILGARYHHSLVDDLEIIYGEKLLRQIAAVIREVNPSIVLTHSLEDYMEDHTNTARLAVTAAFARSMSNFVTRPRRQPRSEDVAIYHAMPHGLCDAMGKRVRPELFINVAGVRSIKAKALAAHSSQQQWLADSQGMNSYLESMDKMAREVGHMSRGFVFAEGWRRHNPLGLGAKKFDPLADALGRAVRISRVSRRVGNVVY